MSVQLSMPVVSCSSDIHHFHIDHNAPCLPPNILHNYCLGFLLGRMQYPEEIENKGHAIFFFFFFWGGGGGGGG